MVWCFKHYFSHHKVLEPDSALIRIFSCANKWSDNWCYKSCFSKYCKCVYVHNHCKGCFWKYLHKWWRAFWNHLHCADGSKHNKYIAKFDNTNHRSSFKFVFAGFWKLHIFWLLWLGGVTTVQYSPSYVGDYTVLVSHNGVNLKNIPHKLTITPGVANHIQSELIDGPGRSAAVSGAVCKTLCLGILWNFPFWKQSGNVVSCSNPRRVGQQSCISVHSQ